VAAGCSVALLANTEPHAGRCFVSCLARASHTPAGTDPAQHPVHAIPGGFTQRRELGAGLPADSGGVLPQEREALESKYRMDLVDALPAKRNEALSLSATTIVEDSAMYGRELPPGLKKRTSAALAANFEKLPVPRKVAQRYKEPEELTMMDWFNFDLASAAALEHWYALEPASCASGTSAPLLIGGAAVCCHCAVNSWPPLPYLMRRQPPTTGNPALEATYAGCRLHCQRRHWATVRAPWYRSLAEPKTAPEPKTVAHRIRSKNGFWVSAEQDPGVQTETPGDWLGVRSRVFLIVGTWPV